MPTPAATHDLAARLALTTTRLARMMRQQDRGELTLTTRAALATIERHGPLTLGELAQIEHIAPPTVTKVINQLDDRGLVDRIPDAEDRRVCRVAITSDGTTLLDADRQRRTAWLASRLSELDDAERERVVAALGVLEGILER